MRANAIDERDADPWCLAAWSEDLCDIKQAARIGGGAISRQAPQDLCPARPGQDIAQSPYSRVLERLVHAREEVVFLEQRDEVQSELKRGRLDANSDIPDAACNA